MHLLKLLSFCQDLPFSIRVAWCGVQGSGVVCRVRIKGVISICHVQLLKLLSFCEDLPFNVRGAWCRVRVWGVGCEYKV